MANRTRATLNTTIDPDVLARLTRVCDATGISRARVVEDGLRARLPILEAAAGDLATPTDGGE